MGRAVYGISFRFSRMYNSGMTSNTVILSNNITPPDSMRIDAYNWAMARPSVEGYEITILDLYFGPPSSVGYYILQGGEDQYARFYELGTEVARSLRSGGVVIGLLGPLSITDRSLNSEQHTRSLQELRALRARLEPHNPIYTSVKETSYDWLEQGFLQVTGIDWMSQKYSAGHDTLLPGHRVEKYITFADHYWTSIHGISRDSKSKTQGTIAYPVYEPKRWDYGGQLFDRPGLPTHGRWQSKVTTLSVGKHTQLPTAAAVQYMDWDGVLILLPPFQLKYQDPGDQAAVGELSRLCFALQHLAQDVKNVFTTERAIEHEEWVYEHRAQPAKKMYAEIETLKQRHDELRNSLQFYDQMLTLLDGTGTTLQNVISVLFDQNSEGIKVEPTEKGAPIDLFVYDSGGRSLVIEITGINGYLRKDDPHWADFLQYLPEHSAKNMTERVERIVLAINTQRDVKLEERNRADDITAPVREIASNNHICVIRTCDLYHLWLKTIEQGLQVQQVFDTLFNCDGIYEP